MSLSTPNAQQWILRDKNDKDNKEILRVNYNALLEKTGGDKAAAFDEMAQNLQDADFNFNVLEQVGVDKAAVFDDLAQNNSYFGLKSDNEKERIERDLADVKVLGDLETINNENATQEAKNKASENYFDYLLKHGGGSQKDRNEVRANTIMPYFEARKAEITKDGTPFGDSAEAKELKRLIDKENSLEFEKKYDGVKAWDDDEIETALGKEDNGFFNESASYSSPFAYLGAKAKKWIWDRGVKTLPNAAGAFYDRIFGDDDVFENVNVAKVEYDTRSVLGEMKRRGETPILNKFDKQQQYYFLQKAYQYAGFWDKFDIRNAKGDKKLMDEMIKKGFEIAQKEVEIANTPFENLNKEQRQFLFDRAPTFSAGYSASFEDDDEELLKDEYYQIAGGAFLAIASEKAEQIKNFRETFNLVHMGANLFDEQSPERRRMFNKYLDDLQFVSQTMGFDGVSADGTHFYKEIDGKTHFLRLNDRFFTALDTMFENNVGSMVGAGVGAVAGYFLPVGNKVGAAAKSAKIAKSLVGSWIGGAAGSAGDYLNFCLRNGYKVDFEIMYWHALQDGLFSMATDAAMFGVEKLANKVAQNGVVKTAAEGVSKGVVRPLRKAVSFADKVVEKLPVVGIITSIPRNLVKGNNIYAAETLIFKNISKEQRADIDRVLKHGGGIKLDETQKAQELADTLSNKYGKDSKIAQTAQKFVDAINSKGYKEKQAKLLQYVLSDETGNNVGYLMEVAKSSPEVMRNLENIIKYSGVQLKAQLNRVGLNETELKNVFQAFEKGTGDSFGEAMNLIATRFFTDNEKVVIDSTPFVKFIDDLKKSGLNTEPAVARFAREVIEPLFNKDGVSFTQLNNIRANLNQYYKAIESPNLKNHIQGQVGKELRAAIDKGIDDLFRDNLAVYAKIKNLYDTALRDYSVMKDLGRVLEKYNLHKRSTNFAKDIDNLINFLIKGEQKTPELSILDEILGELTPENRAVAEVSILKQMLNNAKIVAGQKIGNKNIETFFTQDFFDKLQLLASRGSVFRSAEAKDFIQIVSDWHTLNKNHAAILKELPSVNVREVSKGIATKIQGRLEQIRTNLIMSNAFRLLDKLPFYVPSIIRNALWDKTQAGALRFHLKQILSNSLTIDDFKGKLLKRMKAGKFDNATNKAIQEILDEATFEQNAWKILDENGDNIAAQVDEAVDVVNEAAEREFKDEMSKGAEQISQETGENAAKNSQKTAENSVNLTEIETLKAQKNELLKQKAERNLSKEQKAEIDEQLKDIKQKIETAYRKEKLKSQIGTNNLTPDIVRQTEANKARVIIDELDDKVAAQKLGFTNTESIARSIDGQEIEHTIKRHGVNSELAKNGQPPITHDDIAKYPQITKTADEQLFNTTKDGLPARVSFKQDNGYYVVVEETHNKQGELAFKTMYRGNGDYKNSDAYTKILKNNEEVGSIDPLYLPRTRLGGSVNQTDNKIIPQKANESQGDLEKTSQTPSQSPKIQLINEINPKRQPNFSDFIAKKEQLSKDLGYEVKIHGEVDGDKIYLADGWYGAGYDGEWRILSADELNAAQKGLAAKFDELDLIAAQQDKYVKIINKRTGEVINRQPYGLDIRTINDEKFIKKANAAKTATPREKIAVMTDKIEIRGITGKPVSVKLPNGKEINLLQQKSDIAGAVKVYNDPLTGYAMPHKNNAGGELEYIQEVLNRNDFEAQIFKAAREQPKVRALIKNGVNEKFYSPYQRELAEKLKREFAETDGGFNGNSGGGTTSPTQPTQTPATSRTASETATNAQNLGENLSPQSQVFSGKNLKNYQDLVYFLEDNLQKRANSYINFGAGQHEQQRFMKSKILDDLNEFLQIKAAPREISEQAARDLAFKKGKLNEQELSDLFAYLKTHTDGKILKESQIYYKLAEQIKDDLIAVYERDLGEIARAYGLKDYESNALDFEKFRYKDIKNNQRKDKRGATFFRDLAETLSQMLKESEPPIDRIKEYEFLLESIPNYKHLDGAKRTNDILSDFNGMKQRQLLETLQDENFMSKIENLSDDEAAAAVKNESLERAKEDFRRKYFYDYENSQKGVNFNENSQNLSENLAKNGENLGENSAAQTQKNLIDEPQAQKAAPASEPKTSETPTQNTAQAQPQKQGYTLQDALNYYDEFLTRLSDYFNEQVARGYMKEASAKRLMGKVKTMWKKHKGYFEDGYERNTKFGMPYLNSQSGEMEMQSAFARILGNLEKVKMTKGNRLDISSFSSKNYYFLNLDELKAKGKPTKTADDEFRKNLLKQADKIDNGGGTTSPTQPTQTPATSRTASETATNAQNLGENLAKNGENLGENSAAQTQKNLIDEPQAQKADEIQPEIAQKAAADETPTQNTAQTAENAKIKELETQRQQLQDEFISLFEKKAQNYDLYNGGNKFITNGAELLKRDIENLQSGKNKRTDIPDGLWFGNSDLRDLHDKITKIEQDIEFEKIPREIRQKYDFLSKDDLTFYYADIFQSRKERNPNITFDEVLRDTAKIRAENLKKEFGDFGGTFNSKVGSDKEILEFKAKYRSNKRTFKKVLADLTETLNKRRTYLNTIFEKIGKKPIAEFGQNYVEFYRDGVGAVKKLLAEADEAAKNSAEFNGQVAGAFYRDELGDIDLVWGKNDMGLQKIIKKHLNDFRNFDGATPNDKLANGIDEIIRKGTISPTYNGYNITLDDFVVGLNRGFNKDGVKIGENKWVVTAFDSTPNKQGVADTARFGDIAEGSKSPSNLAEKNSSEKNLQSQGAKEIQQKIQQKFGKDENYARDLYEWHKDSSPLTKDEDGTPKVFYHGSVAKFETFKSNPQSFGIWLTGNKDEAMPRKFNKNDEIYEYEVFVKCKKIYNWSDEDIEKVSFIGEPYTETSEQSFNNLKKAGYDGIYLEKDDILIVFNPNQIKAVENKGGWTDGGGNITPDKPQGTNATHKYFNESSSNIYRSSEIWGSGLAGGTLNGLETDENGNIIGFNPQNFIKGFLAGAGGAKAVKLAIQKSPAIRAKAEKFAAKSAEFLNEALQNPLMLPQERARFAVVANKALNSALDNRKFIIGGEGAIGANREKLARARVMQKQGKDEGEIWDKTGWYLDKDGKWKFEINAEGGEWIQEPTENARGKLSDFLEDDELFAAYPQLQDYKVEFKNLPGGLLGTFDETTKTLEICLTYEDRMKSTLYHELQHAVQHIENFARGGNPQSARAALKRPENQHLVSDLVAKYKDKKTLGQKAYERLHGEVEARNVEERMDKWDKISWGFDEDDGELLDLAQGHPHGTMDEALQDTIIVQDKRRLRGKNSISQSKETNENFIKIKTKNENFKTLKDNFDEKYTKAIKNNVKFTNDETKITATLARAGIKEIINNVDKSVKNGFTFNAHFAVALDLENVFKKAKYLGKFDDIKNGDPNVSIHRFKSAVLINDNKTANALLLLKEWRENGKRIYSLKLDKLEKGD
jgi:hypothetical protein